MSQANPLTMSGFLASFGVMGVIGVVRQAIWSL